jgi:hypothetical protein
VFECLLILSAAYNFDLLVSTVVCSATMPRSVREVRPLKMNWLSTDHNGEKHSGQITPMLANSGPDGSGELLGDEERRKSINKKEQSEAYTFASSPAEASMTLTSLKKPGLSANIRIVATAKPKLWTRLPVTTRNKRDLARKQAAFQAAAPPSSQRRLSGGEELKNFRNRLWKM